MNPISPLGKSAGPSLNHVDRATHTETPTKATPRRSDKVELSDAARLLSRLSQLPDVRQDLVDRVRSEIEAGTYETPEKIDAVVRALAEDSF